MTKRGCHPQQPRSLVLVDHRSDPPDLEARIAERDRRLAADDRDQIARWLGDPPSCRSALAQAEAAKRRRPYVPGFEAFRQRG